MTKGRYRAARTAIESGLAGFDEQNVKIKSSFSFYFTIFFPLTFQSRMKLLHKFFLHCGLEQWFFVFSSLEVLFVQFL